MTQTNRRATILFLSILFFMSAGVVRAQTRFEIQPKESRFWIEGTSSVSSFTCEADDVAGGGRLAGNIVSVSTGHSARAQAHMTIPVQQLDCGKARMNSDLRDALRAGDFPYIQFELQSAEVVAAPASSTGWYGLRALGRLEIAGEERLVTIPAEGIRLADGLYRVRGSMPLRMTDFGVDPPTALLGMVKVRDEIEVHFDVVAACPLLIAEARKEGVEGWSAYADIAAQSRPCSSAQ